MSSNNNAEFCERSKQEFYISKWYKIFHKSKGDPKSMKILVRWALSGEASVNREVGVPTAEFRKINRHDNRTVLILHGL